MNSEQIRLVQDSFRQVVPIADPAAELFYTRLFELDPSLKPLFTGEIAEQGRKLMQMLGMAVLSLRRFDQVRPALRALGARHVRYGVRDVDYDTVRQALLWTLRQGLGDSFTPEVEAAWAEVYATLAAAMQAGATADAEAGALVYAH